MLKPFSCACNYRKITSTKLSLIPFIFWCFEKKSIVTQYKCLQFNILKRFVADGASRFTLLLVLFVLVDGSAVLRSWKWRNYDVIYTGGGGWQDVAYTLTREVANESCDFIALLYIQCECERSLLYKLQSPVNNDTWPVAMWANYVIRNRARATEAWRDKWTLANCSWIIKLKRQYRPIYERSIRTTRFDDLTNFVKMAEPIFRSTQGINSSLTLQFHCNVL